MKAAVITLAAATLAAAPAAHADTLVAPTKGARHVTAVGGWTAWAAPAKDGRFKLVVRTPGGEIADAPIRTFAIAPDADLGSNAFTAQQVVIVYSRCKGTSPVEACDVYEYNPTTRTERKVPGASTKAYSETAPSIASGNVAFVRRGARGGVFVTRLRQGGGASRVVRVDGHRARETAVSVSRVAFLYRNGDGADDVTLAQLDGGNRRLLGRAAAGTLFSLQITRYRVGWLERRAGAVIARLTTRINPADDVPPVRDGKRALPPSTTSAAIAHDQQFDVYADAEGVKGIVPDLFT